MSLTPVAKKYRRRIRAAIVGGAVLYGAAWMVVLRRMNQGPHVRWTDGVFFDHWTSDIGMAMVLALLGPAAVYASIKNWNRTK